MTTIQANTTHAAPANPPFPRRPRMSWSKRGNLLVLFALLVAAAASVVAVGISPASFILGYANALYFLSRVWPLQFPALGDLWGMVSQTLAIVVLSTVFGLVISVPVALLAAHNTTPHPVVRYLARAYIVVQRAVPEFMIALLFVAAFGIGAIPGILGLGLGSVGVMAKLFTDAIEELHPGPREALRAAGAGPVQQIVGAVIPALRPSMVSTTLYAFDINLRASVLLGFIGVGGIGMYISTDLGTLNYGAGLGLTLVLLVICLAGELISGRIRVMLLGPDQARTRRAGPVPSGPAPSGPPRADRVRRLGWGAGAVAIIIASFFGARLSFGVIWHGLSRLGPTFGLYWPPGSGGIMPKLISSMAQTLQMGLAGALLGLVIAVPFGLLSARNVAPARWVATCFRSVVVMIRSVPAIIVGICFVVITGLGPTAGALSLAVASIGFFGKIIADSLEETDVRVQEALRASGAGEGQVFCAATLRQVAPSLASHTMHQLDTSIRAATGLGIVGAGGIGFYIDNAARVLQYGVVTTCTVMVVAAVLIVEGIALWTRRSVR